MTRIKKKRWMVRRNEFNESDIRVVQGLGCEFDLKLDDPQEIYADGKVYRYQGSPPKLSITTTCEKQESMLKLKYGDELVLIQVFHDITPTWTYVP